MSTPTLRGYMGELGADEAPESVDTGRSRFSLVRRPMAVFRPLARFVGARGHRDELASLPSTHDERANLHEEGIDVALGEANVTLGDSSGGGGGGDGGGGLQCSACDLERPRDKFSFSQRKKKAHERRCRACIAGNGDGAPTAGTGSEHGAHAHQDESDVLLGLGGRGGEYGKADALAVAPAHGALTNDEGSADIELPGGRSGAHGRERDVGLELGGGVDIHEPRGRGAHGGRDIHAELPSGHRDELEASPASTHGERGKDLWNSAKRRAKQYGPCHLGIWGDGYSVEKRQPCTHNCQLSSS